MNNAHCASCGHGLKHNLPRTAQNGPRSRDRPTRTRQPHPDKSPKRTLRTHRLPVYSHRVLHAVIFGIVLVTPPEYRFHTRDQPAHHSKHGPEHPKGGRMNVYKLVGRNLEVTDALRNYVDKRLSRLERFSQSVVDARVVLSIKADGKFERRQRVEMQLNVPNGIIRAEEAAADMYQAIDAATDVLERQLVKFRQKFLTRTQRGELPPSTETVGDEQEFEPLIVRNKRFELRPMSPEDAAAQMEALGHDFFVFTNASTNAISVIYKRRDGHYGLIEPH